MSERRRESKAECSIISASTGAQLEEEIDHDGDDDNDGEGDDGVNEDVGW